MKSLVRGFTIAELLISVAALAFIVVLAARIFDSVSKVTSTGTTKMDIDAELRPLFTRLSVDFAKLLYRGDVAAYAKNSQDLQNGNDQIAFYSLVDGFFPTSATAEKRQPQTAIVAYRVNSNHQLERMAKSLAFAGQDSSTPMLFGTANGFATYWPTATSPTATDLDYSVISPATFRLEYYYLLKASGATDVSHWANVSAIDFRDISGIAIAVAMIDGKTRAMLQTSDVGTLAQSLVDYSTGMGTSGLLPKWQETINSSPLPRAALSRIRLAQRIFNVGQ
jgi:type II secretory pathway component PulJ